MCAVRADLRHCRAGGHELGGEARLLEIAEPSEEQRTSTGAPPRTAATAHRHAAAR
ncbi:hypothetical protein ABT324_21685 [Saccharopolyspora sp. NPDC000359]|uniref:hypothetical protein n=1 Tax=Saccharopolyspora sp. NPDC000359 TaxID=3154251 RepID=UPI003321A12A